MTSFRYKPSDDADYTEGWREMGRADTTEAAIRAAHTRLIDEAMAALA